MATHTHPGTTEADELRIQQSAREDASAGGTPLDKPSTAATTASLIADPAPLGLAAFAMSTFVLSCFNAKLIDVSLEAVVLPVALLYGGVAQFLAGMWEFRKGNVFGALAFTSYGAFWMSFAALVKFVAPGLPPATAHQAVGLYLLAWTIFTLYMTIASFRVSGVVFAVFAALTLTFLALTIGEFASATGWAKLGGWLGLVTAALAWYGSFAGVTNSTFRRSVIPTWPRT
jgi:succinate-acetate transporter protein